MWSTRFRNKIGILGKNIFMEVDGKRNKEGKYSLPLEEGLQVLD